MSELPTCCGGIPRELELDLVCGVGQDGSVDLVSDQHAAESSPCYKVSHGC